MNSSVRKSHDLIQNTLLIISFVIFILLSLFAIYSVRRLILLAGMGIGVGVIFSPSVQFLKEKLKIPKGITGILFLMLWAGGLFGIGYLIYHLISGQFFQFSQSLPSILESGKQRLTEIFEKIPILNTTLQKFNWDSVARTSMNSVAQGVQVGTEIITGLIYVIAVSIYTAIEKERYLNGFLSLVPKEGQRRFRLILETLASVLRNWLVAQLFAMACVGLCASIGFLIIGLKYWLVLGILTAVLDIVPFVGPTIAAICACLVTLGSNPEKVTWIILNFIIVEHIESNLVIPLILKGKIDLPPVHLLTMMLIFSHWFGILGILIAPPTLAIGRTIYLMVYIPLINNEDINTEETKAA